MVTARPPELARWAGQKGRKSCPVGWPQLPAPRASWALPHRRQAPRRLKPGGRVPVGALREGAAGQGSEPSGVRAGEQLPLVIQKELGECVDGINGLEGDGSILGPQ